MKTLLKWFEEEGSTRPAALIRIGLAIAIWVRFAKDLAFFSANNSSMIILGTLFFLSSLMMLMGWFSRVSTACTAYILAVLYFSTPLQGYHVYLLIISTAFLALTPCGSSLSVDRWIAIKKTNAEQKELPTEWGSMIGLKLISIQIAAVYLWGAFDKSSMAWISGERLEQIFWYQYSGRPLFDLLVAHPLPKIMALTTLAVEIFLAFAIFSSRLRKHAICLGIGLHLSMYLLLPVNTFSATMIILYLSFIPYKTTHNFLDRLLESSQTEQARNRVETP